MPLIARKTTEQQAQPKQPLFERVQDWIFRLDVGTGLGFFRLGMFALGVLLVVLLYTGTQFYGLRDPEAMDMGQLGRNLWRGRGYVTQNIRPLELWYLNSIGRPPLDEKTGTQPELWTPPMYPWVLSVAFRLSPPEFEVAGGAMTLGADRVLMVVGWVFFLVGLAMMYVLARELFDHRVAVMSSFLYLLCNPLLESAIAGVPIGFLSVLFMVAAWGVLKAEKWQASGRSGWWVNGALAASALAVGLGTLTQYAFVSVLLPLIVYVAVSFPKQWMAKAGLCLGVFLLVLTPWVVRNWKVSKTMFGLSHYELLEGVGEGTAREIRPGELQRMYGGEIPRLRVRQQLRSALAKGRELYEVTLKDVGSNYLIAFFLVALLHRFRQEEVFRLRRFIFWSLLTTMMWLSVVGPPRRNFLTIFLPLIIVYGVAFFYVMFERLQFRTRLLRKGVVGLFALFNALPFFFMLLPPRTTVPYPPYDGGIVTAIGRVFRQEEALVSDIPWAVAWYADRTAIWAPLKEEHYFAINDEVKLISGIYLTQQTLLQQGVLDVIAGHQRFWIQMFQPPQNWNPQFPLQFFRPVSPDGQQVLISNRPR